MTTKINSVREYIESINDDNCLWEMIANYEQFEQDGSIGDCTLRTNAEFVSKQLSIPPHNIVMMMDRIALECYRYFAHKYKNQ